MTNNVIITTGSIPRLLQDGLRGIFGDELKEQPDFTPMMFKMASSSKTFEVAAQLEGFGLATEKDEGDDITFDSRRQGFTPKYIHTAFAKAFAATREALDDELYSQLNDGARALGRAMRATKNVQGARIFNEGFNAAETMVDGDGSQLFSTTHSNGPSGDTFSNTLAISSDLDEASLEAILIQIGEITDARGINAALAAERLIHAPGEIFNAQRLLFSVLQSGTANNDVNAINQMGAIPMGNLSNPFLTDSGAWFITTNAPNGLKGYNRIAPEFEQDNSFTTKNARFSAYERYSFGWDDARGVFGSEGT